jgi:hypothetical protein
MNLRADRRRPPSGMLLVLARALPVFATTLLGCAAPKPADDAAGATPSSAVAAPAPSAASSDTGRCPPRLPAPEGLPGVRPEHATLAYWQARTPDAVLLDAAGVAAHTAALAAPGPPDAAADVFVPEPVETTVAAIRERLTFMRARIASGEHVDGAGGRPPSGPFAASAPLGAVDELRVTLAPVPLRCAPTAAGLYTVPPNPAFDRNLCSTLPAQEALRVVARWPGGFVLVRSRAALGFVAEDAPLSPALTAEEVGRYRQSPPVTAFAPLTVRFAGGEGTLAPGMRVPAADPGADSGTEPAAVLWATQRGLVTATPADPGALRPTPRPLTRHAFLAEAFSFLGGPYGWGGADGGRDCSQFVLEVLGTFGLDLPRNSGQQGLTGTFTVDVAPETPDRERLALLDAAHASGLVLLHLPGHIMFYLGRDADGVPMALHAFAEYVEPCAGGGETLRDVNRVGVSTLELGRGTSRRSFLERIAHLTVFGAPAPAALAGVAHPRPGVPPEGPCPEKNAVDLTVSPRRPLAGRPLRLIAADDAPLGSDRFAITGPDGQRHLPTAVSLGGPPFGRAATFSAASPGEYTVRFGDADRVRACKTLTVAAKPPREAPAAKGPPRAWTPAAERLYALFVERLFDYPHEGELTWPNLHVLLQDTEHNLFLDHGGPDEDAALRLAPDCADLPFTLRAYFAWKLGLAFAVRPCSRAGAGRPPRCGEPSPMPRLGGGPAGAAGFQAFANGTLRGHVQSAGGRTHPDDEATDLYPVPLTREALPPGTVFADPYGHLLVVAQWLPQPAGGTGALIGAEAQPDATIGRRRFWRGAFLHTPDATRGGSGFKAFRPVTIGADGTVTVTSNAALRGGGGRAPFSRQQYTGDLDAFYDAVSGLTDPRPVAPERRAEALIAAFEESAVRRVKSVQNGEEFQRETPRVIPMPEGARIFQTKGPWEDFSTPSRDFRLLIALDTVRGFPDAVARRPAAYGLDGTSPEAVAGVVAALRTRIDEGLRTRRFTYPRSDGSPQSLSLADVAAREAAFEAAYNPNDCPEVRWGAAPGSPEVATCTRRAPAAQQARMETYRKWFRTRTRPVD